MINTLIVDLQSKMYARLCDRVELSLYRAGKNPRIIKRNHSQLKDILDNELEGIDAIVYSGSSLYLPTSPQLNDAAKLMQKTLEQNKYGYGSCSGLQLLGHVLDPEKGKLIKEGSWDKDVEIELIDEDPVFEGVPERFSTRQFHNYSIPYIGENNLGQGTILAKSKDGIEIIRAGNFLASAFHPESLYASEAAQRIMDNYFAQIK